MAYPRRAASSIDVEVGILRPLLSLSMSNLFIRNLP